MVVSAVEALGKVIDDRSGGGLRIGGLVPLFNWQAVKTMGLWVQQHGTPRVAPPPSKA